jgi:tetratricopeptide (TPR) repeat protein
MMELAGEKVLMAPAFHETRIDTSRKTPSTSSIHNSNPEVAARVSSSRVTIRSSHEYTDAAQQLEAGDGLAKGARRHRHKHRHREQRSSHEEERPHKSHKHSHNSPRLKIARSETAAQAVLGSGDGIPNFIEDRKGDQDNVTYGSVHRYSIPRYRTAGHRRVVGLGRMHKILQSPEGNTRILSEDHVDSSVRLKTQSLLVGNADRKKAPIQVVRENTQNRVADLQRDFLSLRAHCSRKRRRLEAQESVHVVSHDQAQVPEQRSAERELQPRRQPLSESGTDNSDSDTSSDSSQDESFEQFRNDARQQKTVELSGAVHDRPQDIEAWLALINHQDGVLDAKDSTTRAPTNAEKYGVADVKISIYETALSKNTSNPERDRLVFGLMEEGSKIWDAKKLANQWRSILKENAQFPNLWIKYLDFVQSNFLTFTYDQCKSVYAECFSIIAAQRLDRNRDQLRIYVLLRLTAFMKDAGYSEHAVGLWQAMLEYNYFHPDVFEGQTGESLFEDFWNSEVARVGEEGARGWKSGSNTEVASTSDTSNLLVEPALIFQSWTGCEQERTLNASLPARTLDEVNDDDPYRVIIFSDIHEYLFRVTEPENKVLLLNAFLPFCSLPPLPIHKRGPEQHWWTDGFLRSSDLSLINIASNSIPRQNIPTASPVTSLVTDTSTMFADPEYWFSCWQDMRKSSSNPRLSRFQYLALRQLVDAIPTNEQLAEYVIAYQLEEDVKEARKLAKALLKQRSSNLRLYNAYALVECRLGNLEAAERVWSTALSMSRTFPYNDRQNAILLWRTWIWQLLDRAELRKAFALLLAIPEGQVDVDKLFQQSLSINSDDVHSTVILKARRTFESNLAQATSLHHSDLICHYSDLLALLAYFTSTDSLTAALAVYSRIIDPSTSKYTSTSTQSSNPTELELVHQSRARLLHLHARTSPGSGFRPAQITLTLASSMLLFPSNSIFLTLYHHHTQRSLVTDRIRTVIPTLQSARALSADPAAGTNSTIPSIFAIWSETTRPSYAGSTRHSIRAAFERAVAAGEAGKASPEIWKWYLRWELKAADTDVQKDADGMAARAQDVFYRGMRACPWAKDFYMLAFTNPRLRDAIRFDGLRRIYETMVEKGLRIHVDLGDILEEWDERDREGAGQGRQRVNRR